MLPHTSSARSGIKKDEWEKELSEWRPSFSFLMKEGGASSADIIPSRLTQPSALSSSYCESVCLLV